MKPEEEHHIHPKFMDNPKGLGKKYNLPKKNHNILHSIIPSIIWKFIHKERKEECIKKVISFSEYYISNLKIKTNKDLNKIFDKAKGKEIVKFIINNGYLLDEESLEYLKTIDKLIDYKKLIWIFENYFIEDKLITKSKLKEILEEYKELNKKREDDNSTTS